MKTVRLEWLQDILGGIMDGTLEIVLRTASGRAVRKAKKRPATRKAAKVVVKKPAKRGRKPKAKKPKKLGVRALKAMLPIPRDIFLFLQDKIDGVKLTALAKHFGVKRNVLKPLLDKLVKRADIETMSGAYFLKRRLRGVGKTQPKKTPVSEKAILSGLAKNPGVTLMGLAKALKEPSYQRLIKPMNALKKAGKVTLKNKIYNLPASQ